LTAERLGCEHYQWGINERSRNRSGSIDAAYYDGKSLEYQTYLKLFECRWPRVSGSGQIYLHLRVAGGLGFEPRLAESESAVILSFLGILLLSCCNFAAAGLYTSGFSD
jgi:hypothetical protein